MKKILYTLVFLFLGLIFVSWGSKGHRKISQNMTACLPPEMVFLIPAWTNYVGNHASDADYRKDQDPDESARHYIDIDNYSEFVTDGRIPQTWDSVVALHGMSFVLGHGILPWATMRTFDSLKSCFQRGDWLKSAQFAADLGHYVGDGHMPLHITRNYNGQYTGQYGIHSRYETSMVGKYESQIVYEPDSANYVENVGDYIFQYIYGNYNYVDSVLQADSYATAIAGNTSSTEYYQALWNKTGNFTIMLMRNGSRTLANLIYTAWLDAGSPIMFPYAIDVSMPDQALRFHVYPNPVVDIPCFEVNFSGGPGLFSVEIYDMTGQLKGLIRREMSPGETINHRLCLEASDLPPGSYAAVLRSEQYRVVRKFVVIK